MSCTRCETACEHIGAVFSLILEEKMTLGLASPPRQRVADEKGYVVGYKNLDELKRNLKPILLRRTRDSVLGDLPPRSDEVVRINPTEEQLEFHKANMRIVSQIVRKPYISEMNLLRLRQALLMCRMSANSG
ncbi:MAG: hypothetical protein FJ295_03840 [Planctomycetes bacterium]|nr:hypothetical protein [Planctomycetota bacterium]